VKVATPECCEVLPPTVTAISYAASHS
jgi:hypothetical protein